PRGMSEAGRAYDPPADIAKAIALVVVDASARLAAREASGPVGRPPGSARPEYALTYLGMEVATAAEAPTPEVAPTPVPTRPGQRDRTSAAVRPALQPAKISTCQTMKSSGRSATSPIVRIVRPLLPSIAWQLASLIRGTRCRPDGCAARLKTRSRWPVAL